LRPSVKRTRAESAAPDGQESETELEAWERSTERPRGEESTDPGGGKRRPSGRVGLRRPLATAVATIVAQTESKPAKIILVGSDGAGVVAVATAAVLKDRLGGVVATEGFRCSGGRTDCVYACRS